MNNTNKSLNATNYSNTSVNLNASMTNNNTVGNNTQGTEKEEQKFNKKKFLKLLKDIAKMLYPGDQRAYENTLYLKLIMPEQ